MCRFLACEHTWEISRLVTLTHVISRGIRSKLAPRVRNILGRGTWLPRVELQKVTASRAECRLHFLKIVLCPEVGRDITIQVHDITVWAGVWAGVASFPGALGNYRAPGNEARAGGLLHNQKDPLSNRNQSPRPSHW